MKGIFPIGMPVLVHTCLDEADLETRIGLVTRSLDLFIPTIDYFGKVDGFVVKNGCICPFYSLEHYQNRVSACFWVHLKDYQVMIDSFQPSWEGDRVKRDIEGLMESIL